jgi:hypothetical protein
MGEDKTIIELYIISVSSPRRTDRPSTYIHNCQIDQGEQLLHHSLIPIVLGEQVLSLLLHYYT